MDIELRLLRSLGTVYETGSVSRAAAAMAYAQQVMSMWIKLLESQIGQPLFLRRPTGLEPTPRGVELYALALTVLSTCDEMMSALRVAPTQDRLRIRMPDDYASGFPWGRWSPGSGKTSQGPRLIRPAICQRNWSCGWIGAKLIFALSQRPHCPLARWRPSNCQCSGSFRPTVKAARPISSPILSAACSAGR